MVCNPQLSLYLHHMLLVSHNCLLLLNCPLRWPIQQSNNDLRCHRGNFFCFCFCKSIGYLTLLLPSFVFLPLPATASLVTFHFEMNWSQPICLLLCLPIEMITNSSEGSSSKTMLQQYRGIFWQHNFLSTAADESSQMNSDGETSWKRRHRCPNCHEWKQWQHEGRW